MELFPAVLVGGPPHSGKSVLNYSLSQALREANIQHYLLRACPDGEGDWANEANQTLVRLIRIKGDWTSEWLARMKRDIANRHLPLLVDVGGRPTPEQETLFAYCTHAILLAPTEKDLHQWRVYAQRQGVLVIAELRSSLTEPSYIETTSSLLKGTIHGLSRGHTAQGVTFEALLEILLPLFHYDGQELQQIQANTAPAELFIDLAALRQTLNLGPEWRPHHLPQLLAYLPAQEALSIYERGANWVYAALACHAYPAPIYQFDVRLGWIEPPSLKHGPLIPPDAPLQAVQYPHKAYLHLSFSLPQAYLEYETGPSLTVPPPDPQRGLILDGKLPMWLWTALARCYREVPWLAVYQPQLAVDGCENCAVVVYSQVADYAVGDCVCLDEPG